MKTLTWTGSNLAEIKMWGEREFEKLRKKVKTCNKNPLAISRTKKGTLVIDDGKHFRIFCIGDIVELGQIYLYRRYQNLRSLPS